MYIIYCKVFNYKIPSFNNNEKEEFIMKIILKIFLVCVCFLSLVGCTNQSEVIWYVPNGTFGYLTDEELYKPINNRITNELNKYMKENNMSFDIIFKCYDDNLPLSEIIDKNEDIDIIGYNNEYYKEFMILDEEIEKKEYQDLKSMFSDNIWKRHYVNGHLYQIPKASLFWSQPTFYIDKNFVDDAKLDISFFKREYIDVVNNIVDVFNHNPQLREKYKFSSSSISLDELNKEKYKSITGIYNYFFEGIVIRKEDKKVINIYEDKYLKEQLNIHQIVYKNNLDDHIEGKDLIHILSCSYDSPKEYYENIKDDTIRIPISKPYAGQSYGYGILNSSIHKKESLEALQLINTNEEISNLLIYGIEGEDYHIENQRAITVNENDNISAFGSFNHLGNNLIAYPSQLEPLNKKELEQKYDSELNVDIYDGFIPDLSHIRKEYESIHEIYSEAIIQLTDKEMNDLDKFYKEVNEKLYKQGLQKVIDEIQKQLDTYLENNNET